MTDHLGEGGVAEVTNRLGSVELLFCVVQGPRILAVLGLERLLLGPADGDQFLHQADVRLDLVVHQRDLFVVLLRFADRLLVALDLGLDRLDPLPLQTAIGSTGTTETSSTERIPLYTV